MTRTSMFMYDIFYNRLPSVLYEGNKKKQHVLLLLSGLFLKLM